MKILRIILAVGGVLAGLSLFFMPRITMGWYLVLAAAVVLLAYAALLPKLPKWLHISVLALAMIPVLFAGFLAAYGSVSTATHEEDVVIVLGAAIHGDRPSRMLAYRLNAALEFHMRNPQAVIVVSGGYAEGRQFSEAQVMAWYLTERGVPAEQILLENRAVSTEENLRFGQQMLREHFGHDDFTVTIATQRFHLYRARFLARRIDLDATQLPARTIWRTLPMDYLREMFAVGNAWLGNPLTRHMVAL
ncbi:MAG: YdcF family protein [Oscillospiraceae bacterium]|nr:YdcF family protein [Oscillospiraceae bacterium]